MDIKEEAIKFYSEKGAYAKRAISKVDDTNWQIFNDFIYKAFKIIGGKQGKILELGCGNGLNLHLLSEKFSSNLSVGLDLSIAELSFARDNFNKSGYLKGDITHLPFSDESFNIVFSHAVVEHLYDAENSLNEMKRVLKKGGYLIISSPNMLSPVRNVSLFFWSLKNFFKRGVEAKWHPDGNISSVFFTIMKILKRIYSKKIIFEYRQPVYENNVYLGSDFDATFLINPYDLLKWAKRNNMRILNLMDAQSGIGILIKKIFPKMAGGILFICQKEM